MTLNHSQLPQSNSLTAFLWFSSCFSYYWSSVSCVDFFLAYLKRKCSSHFCQLSTLSTWHGSTRRALTSNVDVICFQNHNSSPDLSQDLDEYITNYQRSPKKLFLFLVYSISHVGWFQKSLKNSGNFGSNLVCFSFTIAISSHSFSAGYLHQSCMRFTFKILNISQNFKTFAKYLINSEF